MVGTCDVKMLPFPVPIFISFPMTCGDVLILFHGRLSTTVWLLVAFIRAPPMPYTAWTNLRRIWKLQGRFHDASFLSTNGLFQGDPTAPACLAAFLCQPIRELGELFPEVLVSVYADDALVSCNDANQMRAAHEFFVRWLQEQNVELNTRKCTWASTSRRPASSCSALRSLRL